MKYYLFSNSQGTGKAKDKGEVIREYCKKHGITVRRAKELLDPIKEISPAEYRIRQREEMQ